MSIGGTQTVEAQRIV